jgi:oxygen-independent coproporphyrinogen-3 oxidase
MTQPCRSLYIHVPICRRKCGYCDFYSAVADAATQHAVVAALQTELDRHAAALAAGCETIYIGGGTPTALPSAELAALLAAVAPRRAAGTPVEFTVEANPATVTPATAEQLVEHGVNRVSIGAQSFSPRALAALDREHDPDDVARTIEICRGHGIENLSLDLIFGAPGQSLDDWARDLESAIALRPEHISCYGLTYEPGTPLYAALTAGRVAAVDPDLEADMYTLMIERLPAAGLAQYEISNFARPGRACLHNMRCWQNDPYVGVGPSAAGYVDGVRYRNVPDIAAYVERVPAGADVRVEEECLVGEPRAREAAMLALRTNAGIQRAAFAERYGFEPATLFANAIARHAPDGLLAIDDASIRLTPAGFMLANRVLRDFV